METTYLKTLVVAADTGSFSKAASVLCITQSAVSQRIKFLEERYGHQLLDRSGSVLVLTEAGKLVLKKAEEILVLEKDLQDEMKHFGGKRRFSLCCTPTFGIVFLPGVLKRFMLKHADIADIKFIFNTPEQALKGLMDNEFDIAILEHCDDVDLSAFPTFPLPQDKLVFISSPAMNLPTPMIDLQQLFEQRLFARKDGCSSRKLLKMNLTRLGHDISDFKRMVIYDDLRLTVETVASVDGISFVSTALVKDQLDEGKLLEHHVEGFCHYRHRSVAVNKKCKEDFMLRDFLNCIMEVFGLPPAKCDAAR